MALAGLLVLSAGCVEPPERVVERELAAIEREPWEDPDEVVIRVNDQAITRGEIYRRILQKFGTLVILTGIIKEELFFQEADRLNITVGEDEVWAEVDRRMEQEASDAGGLEELRKIYQGEGLTLEDVRRSHFDRIEPELRVIRTVQALRVINESVLRDYYQRTYSKTRRRVRQIAYRYRDPGAPPEVVERKKADALEKALRVIRRARDGEDFGRIARDESEDEATASRDGDLGYVAVDDPPMPPQVREAIFSLRAGEVSEPVEFDEAGTMHVFQVTDIAPHRSYEESRESMRREIRERIPDLGEIEAVLKRLRDGARVEIFTHPSGGFFHGARER